MAAKRTDANQTSIVKALRQLGASVQPLHEIGKGCPDILVGFRGVNHVLEIKDGSKPPSKRKLTDDEIDWHAKWNGTVYVVESIDQAIATVCRVTAYLLGILTGIVISAVIHYRRENK